MENNQKQRPYYFSLNKDGDSAIVRVLHSNISTIEKMTSHRIEVDGKKRRAKCLGQDCPLCANGNQAEDRIYIHVWDYADNREKVWERTDKILPELEKIQANWTPLNTAVLKITRKGDSFPKYSVEALNPMQYANVDNSLVDEALAVRFAYNRKAEDLVEFIRTGKFPERKPYVSKEEYAKQHSTQQNTQPQVAQVNTTNVIPQAQVVQSVQSNVSTVNTVANDDPFVGDFFNTPRRV